jgi:Methyltransferase FkbM domain
VSGYFGATSRERLPDFQGVDAAGALELWVPTITLSELLDRCGIDHVDFVSIDVEHAEAEVIAGFDLERFGPALVCVEIGVRDPERSVTPHFTAAAYERVSSYCELDGVNWWFARC